MPQVARAPRGGTRFAACSTVNPDAEGGRMVFPGASLRAWIALLPMLGSALWPVPAGAVINGAPGAVTGFREIVRVETADAECTGTLIGPRVLLTAAHCTLAGHGWVRRGGEAWPVRLARSALFRSRGHDLGVGILRTPLPGARYATVGVGVAPGDRLELLGFGCTRPAGVPGALHRGLSRVVRVAGSRILSRAPGGGALCYGDSGGPAYVTGPAGRRLVGIHAAGDIRAWNLDIRLDAPESREFLRQVARRYGVGVCGINLRCP
jgi:hypothetical protein